MKIGIIGIGYVGLPLITAFCKNSVQCIGFDIDSKKVDSLNNGKSFLEDPTDSDIQNFIKNKLFLATTDFTKVKEVTHLIICVPTPIDQHKNPDLRFVINSLESSIRFISKGTLISLESTTYPGTSREIIKPLLEKSGMVVGKDVFLSFSPEREDPGNEYYNLKNTPKVISGFSQNCIDKAREIYSIICSELVEVSSLEIAEMTKLIENIQRSVNIGLMNEMKILSDAMNINIYEVIDAASTKPFGFSKYYPGPGVGGHCIPVDPYYLAYKAKQFNIDARFIELAGEINDSMPNYVVDKVMHYLNDMNLSISQSRILCLGISYKKNVGDTRESPPVEIFDKLFKLNADVAFSDPYFDIFPDTKKYKYSLPSIELTYENINSFDIVLLLTDHDAWNYEEIFANSKFIIDTRGKFYNLGISSQKIVQA